MATFAWGTVFYGHSVYMEALSARHGWSPALISRAIVGFWLATLPGTLSAGLMVDRFGPAPVVALGGLCVGGGLALLAAVGEPWQLFAIYALLGFGYPALASPAISATLAPWFERGFGTALAIALSGASLGGAVLPFSLIRATERFGFAPTMLACGLVVLATMLVVVLALQAIGRPEGREATSPARTAAPFADTLRRGRFWHIALACGFGLGGQVGLLAHQIPIVAAATSRDTAALSVTLVAVSAALGRVLVGWTSRTQAATRLAACSYLLHGIGMALLGLAESVPMVLLASIVAGLPVGAIVMLPPVIVREAFGAVGYGLVIAMTTVVMYVLAALSPWLVGELHGLSSGYGAGLALLAGMELVAVLAVLAIPAAVQSSSSASAS